MKPGARLLPARFSTIDARRICLIKPSALGDVVQTLPVLAALRYRFPYAQIAWVVNSAYADLLRPIRRLDRVIEFPRHEFSRLTLGAVAVWRRFLRRMRREEFDIAIDLQGLWRSGWMCGATGARLRIGLESAREGAWWFYNATVDDCAIDSAALRYWTVAQAFGVGHLSPAFPLDLSEAERAWARGRLAGLCRPRLAISPGARWVTKRWPAPQFAAVAGQSLGLGVRSVVLVGGPDDRSTASQIVGQIPQASTLDLCGQTTLRELAAILEQCDVLLTNDSGPMHLAAAVGTRCVAIFTCTKPERAAPFGPGHRVVQTEVSCRGSYLKQCDRLDCMRELNCDRVAPAVIQAIRDVQKCEPEPTTPVSTDRHAAA
jgi:lipopolysaccharide heptosyltransferase I